MLLNKLVKTTALLVILLFLFTHPSFAGFNILDVPETDSGKNFILFSFFDLRDRESFVQVTNLGIREGTVHVQIFDVSNNCNENNFFDSYTVADTNVYNMRDIQTNDGNPSGVVLPDDAYGFVSVITIDPVSGEFNDNDDFTLIGNFRVIDDNGYEYRTNSVNPEGTPLNLILTSTVTFNFNTKNNVTLADVVGIVFDLDDDIVAADLVDNYVPAEINILNEDEVIFSCRNVVFACTDQDNPLYETLLEEVNDRGFGASSNVASFEYGINNAIPHSRGGELLCPGNTITNGIVTIDRFPAGEGRDRNLVGYIGLNNGNGRGSMDSLWFPSTPFDDDDDGASGF